MTNHNLTQVLQTFSKKEWKELRKWLQSPVHNQREDVLRLFDFVADQEVSNNLEQVDKEVAYRFTYPETPFDDAD